MARMKRDTDDRPTIVPEHAAELATFVTDVIRIAGKLGTKDQPLTHFWLAPAQRGVLLGLRGGSSSLKLKLAKEQATFSVTDVTKMMIALAAASIHATPQKQLAISLVARHLKERLHESIPGLAEPTKKKRPKKADPDAVYQFRITLIDSQPSIWRRIQVEDCTLDKLHEHIQTAMGWENSHLHQFDIKGKQYSDPDLWDDEFDLVDSTRTKISTIVPRTGKRFRFAYEYDFGDNWKHEIMFEGCPKKEPGKEYPLCLEGERACPPEDVGGLWGYADFLEVMANPNDNRHDEFREWAGDFDQEKFDVVETTKAMREGVPGWDDDIDL